MHSNLELYLRYQRGAVVFSGAVPEPDGADEGATFFEFRLEAFIAVDVLVIEEYGHLLEALVDGWHWPAMLIMIHCELCTVELTLSGVWVWPVGAVEKSCML